MNLTLKIIQMAPTQINRGAKFSQCKKYRLQLLIMVKPELSAKILN